MSCLNCALILLLISIIMTKINYANGKSYGREMTYGSYSRYKHENAVRHHHHQYWRSYYRRPYFEKPHAKRTPRKFAVLDQIDHRLNNAVDYFNEKHPKTTSNPLVPYDLKSFANMYMTNSVHAQEDDNEKALHNRIDHRHHMHVTESLRSWDKFAFDDVEAIADSRGYLQDVTTSRPSLQESTRLDTSLYERKNFSSIKSTTAPITAAVTTTSATTTEGPPTESVKTTSWVQLQSNLEHKTVRTATTSKAEGLQIPESVYQHLEHLDREGKCKTPKPKVIRVQEVHPHPSKIYMPPCTILHQCGADTGCCKNLKDVCKPKNKTKVELYFLTIYMGKQSKVEKLKFENHTECECRSRTEELIAGDSPYVDDYIERDFTARTGRMLRSHSCTCPSQYSPRNFHNGTCICDCFDKQADCLTLKKGKGNFSFEDRRCIKDGKCSRPSCKFGHYSITYGRCPEKKEHQHYSKPRDYVQRPWIT